MCIIRMQNHKRILTRELEAVGLRLNQKPPQIYFRHKKTGGITFNAAVKITNCDEIMVRRILQEYRIHNCEVLFKEDATVDQLIDVIEGPEKARLVVGLVRRRLFFFIFYFQLS